MSGITVTKSKPIYLRHDDPSRVLVHPDTEDKSIVSAAEAVFAILKWGVISERLNEWAEQLSHLLKKLQDWSQSHSKGIHRSDVQVRGAKDILFVVMQRDIPHDDDLACELADFDFVLFNDPDFSELQVNTRLIPRCSIDSMQAFVNLDKSICIAEF